MRSLGFRSLVWMLVLCLPAVSVMADVEAAMLYAKGKVTVNGKLIGRSTTIFAGDKIRTGVDSMVTIAGKGSNVLISPNSGVAFGANRIEVNEGSATVTTSSGMTAVAGGLRISPVDSGKARFEVVQQKGSVQVSALAGRLSLSDGKMVTVLEAGRQLTTARAGVAGVPQGSSSLAGAAVAAIVAAVVAGVSTAVIFATVDEQPDTSPSTFRR